MVPDPFQRRKGTAVIGPGHRGPRHQPHIGQRRQFPDYPRRPIQTALAANFQRLTIQPTAKQRILLCQDHISPGAGGGQGRHQAGRAGADHQQVAKGKGLFIVPLVMFSRQFPQTGGPADQGFIQAFPKRARPHEGLVVKPRPEKRRREVVDCHHIMAQRRPAVLAERHQPVMQFQRGGAEIWRIAVADQRVRLL